MGVEKKIFIIWPYWLHPWFSTIDPGAMNFGILVDLLIDIITMDLVFFPTCVEVETIFENLAFFHIGPTLEGPGVVKP